jgi:hypothetical protein
VFDSDFYDLVDGWVIGALLLWLVAEEAIRREDLLFKKGRQVVRAGGPAELRDVLTPATRSPSTPSPAPRCSDPDLDDLQARRRMTGSTVPAHCSC